MKKLIFAILLFLPMTASAAKFSLVDPAILGDCLTTGNCNLCNFIGLLIHGTDIMISLGGVLSVLIIVAAGLWMVTSWGDKTRYDKGKSMITAVIIGLLIMMIAWTLINTIMTSLYGPIAGSWYKTVTGQSDWGVCPNKIPDNITTPVEDTQG